jgi:hypothetical protein
MSRTELHARLRVKRRRKSLSRAALVARSGASRVRGGCPEAPEPALERQLARERERSRRLRLRLAHARLAAQLLSAKGRAGAALVRRALSVVDRWERDGLCSRHYVSRWRALLSGPRERVARSLLDPGDWADALFQNTPFSFALEPSALSVRLWLRARRTRRR